MSINLVNIMVFAKNKFNNFNVSYNNPPSFLKTITNKDEKVIFVCRVPDQKLISYESPISPNKISANTDQLDLTGSPLKDDCTMETLDFSIDLQLKSSTPWSKEEECFLPIELEKVRGMMSDQKLQEEGRKTSSVGSMWFLCKSNELDNSILMSLNFENGFNSRGFVKYNDLIEGNSISSDKLMSIHYSFLRGVNPTETYIENSYNIKPNITLKLSWTTSAARPQLINVKNCTTILCQTIGFEDDDSVIEHFWRQLTILSLINEDITASKNNDVKFVNEVIREELLKWGRGIEMDMLKEKIVEAMTELPSYCGTNENDLSEIEAVVARARNRCLTDITDKLWEILKCCSSYRDLKVGFTHVFQCAAQRNIINMPINENSLAKIIREVAQRRLAIPCLTGTEPLELLLEIGLEKLQKDYEYILTESKICGLTDLLRLQNRKPCIKIIEQNFNVRSTLLNAAQKSQNQINRKTLLHNLQNCKLNEENDVESIGFKNSKYNEREIEIQLAKLYQIHIALEHLLSIQINLNLKNVYNQMFEQLLQRPLPSFPRSIKKCTDSIAISILTDKIVGHVENTIPHVRRIVILSTNKFKEVESTFYYSMENIYPPNVLNSVFDVTEEKQASKSEYYFHTTYIRIRSRRS